MYGQLRAGLLTGSRGAVVTVALISLSACRMASFSSNGSQGVVQNGAGAGSSSSSSATDTTAPRCQLTASMTPVAPGQPVTLTLTASGDFTATILNGHQSNSATQSVQVAPTVTTAYAGYVSGPNGGGSCGVTVVVATSPSAPSCTVSAAPSAIQEYQSTVLTVTTSADTTSTTVNGVTIPARGETVNVFPSVSTVYKVVVIGPGGTGGCNAEVIVTPALPTCTLSANPLTVQSGQPAVLTFVTSSETTSATLNGTAFSPGGGTLSVSPTSSTNYVGIVKGVSGQGTCSVTVQVTFGSQTPTCTLTATPNAVAVGQSSTLNLVTSSQTVTATINGISVPATGGSLAVTPSLATTYTGEVTGATGLSSQCSALVTVQKPPLSFNRVDNAIFFPPLPTFSENQTVITDVLFDSNTTYVGSSLQGLWATDSLTQPFRALGNLNVGVTSLFASGNNICVGTSEGGLALSNNGGVSFTMRSGPSFGTPITSVAFSPAFLAVVSNGSLSVSTDQGNSFLTPLPHSVGVVKTQAVGGNLYALSSAGLMVSQNAGASFRVIEPNALSFETFESSLIVGTTTGIEISTDGGNTFPTKTSLNSRVVAVGMNNQYSFAVVPVNVPGPASYQYFGMQVSGDGGVTFGSPTPVPPGFTGSIAPGLMLHIPTRIFMVGNYLFAFVPSTGTDTALFMSADLGYSFITATPGTGINGMSDIYGDNSGNIFGTTAFGLLVSKNSGQTFSPVTAKNGLPQGAPPAGIAGVANKLFVTGPRGLWVSADEANTFTNATANLSVFFSGRVAAQGNSVFFTYGDVYLRPQIGVSGDGGSSFESPNLSASGLAGSRLQDISGSQNMVLVGTEQGLGLSVNAGQNFAMQNGGSMFSNNIDSVYYDPSTNCVYAGLKTGLAKSCNGGSYALYTYANGLPATEITQVYASGQNVFAVASGGYFSISLNGGAAFYNYGIADGINNPVRFKVTGSMIYIATQTGYASAPLVP